jgi:KaiC/GvpD/RAD55 family RecA-like ATPase
MDKKFNTKMKKVVERKSHGKAPYRVRSLNKVLEDAKALPPTIRLYGDLLFKNEVTILAGDTGVGKSILAVDIAIGLARGDKKLAPFINEDEALKVLYLDYELTDRQVRNRFRGAIYPENLYRVDIDPDCDSCDITIDHLDGLIEKHQCNVLIVDNISMMASVSTKDPEVAIKIMKEFKQLQKKYGITILALAHTPKRYENNPLQIEDVAGSKMIANYADNIFFIANSVKGNNIRYIKQVKQRNTEMERRVFELELKSDDNGLHFEYLAMGEEKEHLREPFNNKSSRDAEIRCLYKGGKTQNEIGDLFQLNKSTVSRIINSQD